MALSDKVREIMAVPCAVREPKLRVPWHCTARSFSSACGFVQDDNVGAWRCNAFHVILNEVKNFSLSQRFLSASILDRLIQLKVRTLHETEL
jgi:hypothetical protein